MGQIQGIHPSPRWTRMHPIPLGWHATGRLTRPYPGGLLSLLSLSTSNQSQVRTIKSSYVQCGSKLSTAAAAALYIRDFMQHSRHKIRQPLSLSEPPPAPFCPGRARFPRCSSCPVRHQIHRRPSAPRGSPFFLLTAAVPTPTLLRKSTKKQTLCS